MFTASMIEYNIDNESKVIKACVNDIKYDAIDTMLKGFRKENMMLSNTDIVVGIPCNCDEDGNPDFKLVNVDNITTEIYPMTTCKKYLLPDHLEATAMYDPNDPNPYSEVRGKEIARRRLYNMYNRALHTALDNIRIAMEETYNNITHTMDLTRDRMTNFAYYEYYDIMKKNLETSEKL